MQQLSKQKERFLVQKINLQIKVLQQLKPQTELFLDLLRQRNLQKCLLTSLGGYFRNRRTKWSREEISTSQRNFSPSECIQKVFISCKVTTRTQTKASPLNKEPLTLIVFLPELSFVFFLLAHPAILFRSFNSARNWNCEGHRPNQSKCPSG